jgi:hypothetical protein
MPNLLYIGQNPTTGTGSPVIVLRHLRRFAAEGWSVAVLGEYGGDYRDCRAAGWTVHEMCHRRWWWPPFRNHSAALRWMRLRLLAHEVAALNPSPTVILSYLAAHSDFSADLAGHVAQLTGAPLHILVHDDVSAFPNARGQESSLRRAHETILEAADVCWFVSPELADRFPSTTSKRRLLYPLPEGWDRPAVWSDAFATKPAVYYAGHLWREQHALLAEVAACATKVGSEVIVMARESAELREFCLSAGVRWQPPFPTNREALNHLASTAAGVLVSYAATVDDMPWSATSFPSKLVEYCHLGLPIAVVAPADSAVVRWARRVRFPYVFEPGKPAPIQEWFAGLRQREVWQVRAALSLHLARTEFDPRRIQSELAEAMIRGTERRAA